MQQLAAVLRSRNWISAMVILFLAAFSVNTTFGQLNTLDFEDFDDLQGFFQRQADRIPLISAHRGGFYPGFPENAIETFEYTISNIYAVIECDVRETSDGILVMMHDKTLDRTTNCAGTVSELSFDEMKSCLLVDQAGEATRFNIPTLDEVLKWADGKTVLMLDVKRGVDFKKVVDEVKDNKAEDRVAIITYTPDAASDVYELHPEVLISTTIRNLEELERISNTGVPEENLLAFVGVKEPGQELYAALHKRGIYATLGTMGNLDRKAEAAGDNIYSSLVQNGADILSTDRPFEAGAIVNKILDKKSPNYKYFKQVNPME